MAWVYVGPEYDRGILLNDGSYIFPLEYITNAAIDDLLILHPNLRPYWRQNNLSNTDLATVVSQLVDDVDKLTPKGEFLSDAHAAVTLDNGDTYLAADGNAFGVPRGFHKTLYKP